MAYVPKDEDEDNPFDIEEDWELHGASTVKGGFDSEDETWGDIEANESVLQSVSDEQSNKSNQSGAGAPSEGTQHASSEHAETSPTAPKPDDEHAMAPTDHGIMLELPPAADGSETVLPTNTDSSLAVADATVGAHTLTDAPPADEQLQEDNKTDLLTEAADPTISLNNPPQDLPSPLPRPVRDNRSSGGGSTSSWGWGLGSRLIQVAAGAVRDVKELTGSLQQALAEVQDDSEAEDDKAKGHVPSAPEPMQPPTQLDTPERAVTLPIKPVAEEAPEPISAERSSGDSGQSDLDEVDQHMEQLASGAAKALSNLWGGISGVARNTATLVSKVEAATFEIAKDLVSGAGVGQDITQLQQAAANSVRGVAVNVGRIGTRIEASLETVGRTALGLLEEVTGQHEGHPNMDSPTVRASPAAQRTFDELFDLYGGRQLSEDHENLANECARIANRARAKLEESQQAELDATMALLGPIFSRPLANPTTDWQVDDQARTAFEQLEQRYEPIRFLCRDSVTRAKAFRELLLAALHEDAARPATATATTVMTKPSSSQDDTVITPPAVPITEDSTTEIPAETATMATPAAPHTATTTTTPPPETITATPVEERDRHEDTLADEVPSQGKSGLDGWEDEVDKANQAAASQQLAEGSDKVGTETAATAETLLRAALVQVRSHAFKRMAELATAQLQLLVDHAVNLAAPARSVDVQAGSAITWPPAARDQAGLVRQQAQQMLQDMEAVGGVYSDAVNATLQMLNGSNQAAAVGPTPAEDEGVLVSGKSEIQAEGGMAVDTQDMDLCQQVVQQLLVARQSACAGLEEAFRSLLFSVLVRELVQRIAS